MLPMINLISKSVIFFSFLLLHCFGGPTKQIPKQFTQADAESYLNKFGYLTVLPLPRSSQDLKAYNEQKAKQKEEAIKKFQTLTGIPVTGKIDEKTTTQMLAPRCGISDLDSLKREGIAKWDKERLQWAIKAYSSQLSEGDQRRGMTDAFNVWSNVAALDFVEVSKDSTDADIQVRFAGGTHDDPYPFDGKGLVLAHAFYPKDGRLHLDDDEKWAYNEPKKLGEGYTDLTMVAAHELGHALGLSHSKDKGALMYPYYRKPQEGASVLNDDDIRRIQQLYGPRKGSKVLGTPVATTRTTTTTTTTKPRVKPQPQPPNPPNGMPGDRAGGPDRRCPTSIDAATTAMNSQSYFFYGNSVWIVDSRGSVSSPLYVDQLFPKGPPSGVTAAVTNQNSQLTLLFQNRRIYAFEWNARDNKFELHPDFPKDLTNEVPFVPKSAFRWIDGNVMLVNGNDFVIFDEYWNKPSFANTMSNYFSNIPSTTTEIFNNQNDIIILNGAKFTVFDGTTKELRNDMTLKQLLKC